ncbi:PREDICTED: protein DELAY OF GERMINATION 1-like [Nicotiana attenuata]|uniref:Transcription factor hbp-1b(C38) n=1 Tax=Nicotiana attenuata TaxID=49451 RepID=A0A1J6JU18_NICAT|nr:PREDICTED: protein DELAY OF GERMINATION 1-like [Nicotiana attenuata]OIT21218.1 transcription factor hbp-1b(c38) [Nicotiana attenuata]
MASSLMSRNGVEKNDKTFHKFFETWLAEQKQELKVLVSASRDVSKGNNNVVDERVLVPLIKRVIQHYEGYYGEKSKYIEEDVFGMLNPTWRSNLEGAFLWIGGWRPSMAFHLLYSKSGLQFEACLPQLIRGITTGDLGDLSPDQIGKVDELQKKTIWEEKNSSEKLARVQESVADASMVELSHIVTQLMMISGSGGGGGGGKILDEEVEANLATKEEGLVIILQKADNLRLNTLKEILAILTPTQAIHFLIAAAELHLRLHEWGKIKDATTTTTITNHNHLI